MSDTRSEYLKLYRFTEYSGESRLSEISKLTEVNGVMKIQGELAIMSNKLIKYLNNAHSRRKRILV